MSLIIEARNLTKRYRDHLAVNNVDLHIREGEIFGILGPNGAGKTTTLEMIEGLRAPDSGTITVDGIDAIAESARVRRIIGVQLQSTALFPYLTSAELIELFASIYDVPDPASRVPELLRLVDLEDKARAKVDEMSGGQQQRLSIALALVNQPRVTFLDEPTTGLDPHARRNLWETILGVRKAGTTVVLTTHYMEEAEVLCDRVAIMDEGQVIACDTPAGLIRALDLEGTVSASIEGDATIAESDLSGLPGVVTAAISSPDSIRRLTMQSNDAQATITSLLQLAHDRGIILGDLGSTRATLEDVFLARTGRSYADHEEQPPEEPATKQRRGRRAA
ncbi:MAG TPA: ABC transporter ATP-binding protein [Thermomicrobiales bacterium]|nr:ABC transporter ATP-binding protein [Thermomicrobiales bacterium]